LKELLNKEFNSKIAVHINSLIAEKRALGYSYNNELLFLWRFDKFLAGTEYDTGIIDDKVMRAWSELDTSESHNSRKYRLDATRMLTQHMQSLGLSVCAPPILRKEYRPLPYFPERHEIGDVFATVDNWQGHKTGWYSHTAMEFPIALRMCYVLGMRIGEVVSARTEDFDWENRRLLITHSKGDKHRYVYFSDELAGLLRRYDRRMESVFPDRLFFFPGVDGSHHISRSTTASHFREAWRLLHGTPGLENGKRCPTVHTLRHCFVIHIVNDWVGSGLRLDQMVPYLSKHLGHSSFQESYYYFHQMEKRSPAIMRFIGAAGQLPKEVFEHEEKW
jgi:integrase/recombinase XerD